MTKLLASHFSLVIDMFVKGNAGSNEYTQHNVAAAISSLTFVEITIRNIKNKVGKNDSYDQLFSNLEEQFEAFFNKLIQAVHEMLESITLLTEEAANEIDRDKYPMVGGKAVNEWVKIIKNVVLIYTAVEKSAEEAKVGAMFSKVDGKLADIIDGIKKRTHGFLNKDQKKQLKRDLIFLEKKILANMPKANMQQFDSKVKEIAAIFGKKKGDEKDE